MVEILKLGLTVKKLAGVYLEVVESLCDLLALDKLIVELNLLGHLMGRF